VRQRDVATRAALEQLRAGDVAKAVAHYVRARCPVPGSLTGLVKRDGAQCLTPLRRQKDLVSGRRSSCGIPVVVPPGDPIVVPAAERPVTVTNLGPAGGPGQAQQERYRPMIYLAVGSGRPSAVIGLRPVVSARAGKVGRAARVLVPTGGPGFPRTDNCRADSTAVGA
jgi:hypothetical protein